ncbi:hypothetical protein C1645_818431 [Glomus cerebriforme]|uniref:Uncharacterized protein n=1 Tax=Glomus cerebriforme TaxID=658196 RepID=A0A397TCW5_9GLOM|nr:hypothetical protein C1645_818431 [Glomus cerebriforme]
MSRRKTSKTVKKRTPYKKHPKIENPWLLFSKNYIKLLCGNNNINSKDAMKLASEEWEKMPDWHKNQWYHLSHQKKLLRKMKEIIPLLSSMSIKFIESPYNNIFIMDETSFKSMINQAKANQAADLGSNNSFPISMESHEENEENGDIEKVVNQLFEEFINFDMLVLVE